MDDDMTIREAESDNTATIREMNSQETIRELPYSSVSVEKSRERGIIDVIAKAADRHSDI